MEKLTEKEAQNLVASKNLTQVFNFASTNKGLSAGCERIMLHRVCTFLQNHDSSLPGRHTDCLRYSRTCSHLKQQLGSYIEDHGIHAENLEYLRQGKEGEFNAGAVQFILEKHQELAAKKQ